MARSLLLTALLLAACTRPNGAFDPDIGDDVADDTEQGESETRGSDDSESETGERDLPTECPFMPVDGLDLRYGLSAFFGNNCPDTDIWGLVSESVDGTIMVETCSLPNCGNCATPQPLSMFPLRVDDYLPPGQTCLKIQTRGPLGLPEEVCRWGAISIYDGLDGTPYVIATSHLTDPTPMGATTLGTLIPEPVLAGNCNCEAIGQGNDCCYGAPTPPEFWGYPWGDNEVLTSGESASIPLSNPIVIPYSFKVIQAQRTYPECGNWDLSFSWAVVAELP